jgi:ATP-dependent RNA helicase HelY
VRNYTPEQAHHLLNSSFAQFLADRGVVALERSRQQDLAALEGYRKNMVCHLGDFEEYWGYLDKARQLRDEDRRARDQGRREDIRESVARLRPGDVVWVPRARRRGVAVVVSSRDGKPTVLAQDRQFFRLNGRDFEDPPQVLTRIPLPKSGSVRNPRFRRDVAARLVALDVKAGGGRRPQTNPKVEREAARLEALAEAHPCRRCPERAKHERWAARASELQRRLGGVERRIRVRTETLARQFDRVLSVLVTLGYVDDWSLTTKGRTLTRIYGEGDLLVGEALEAGLLDDLRPSEVVGLLSAVIYEGRERVPLSGEMPTAETKERYERLQRLWRKVRRTEDEHQVQLCRELEAGFATPIYHWAEGEALNDILAETEMAPGDFIRNCKQLVDLLRQVEEVASPETAAQVRVGREAILRGVVAYTGV